MKVNIFDKYGETIGYHVEVQNVFNTYHPENEDIIMKTLERQGEALLMCKDGHDMYRLKNCDK